MSDDGTLFELANLGFGTVDETPETVVTVSPLTPDQRLKARREAALAAGWHPLSVHRDAPAGMRLAGNGETCGSCALRMSDTHNGRRYSKCTAGSVPIEPVAANWIRSDRQLMYGPLVTHSAATDVRQSWPACTKWEDET